MSTRWLCFCFIRSTYVEKRLVPTNRTLSGGSASSRTTVLYRLGSLSRLVSMVLGKKSLVMISFSERIASS